MSTPEAFPQCEWTGVSPDEDDRTITCGRPASGYVIASTGQRIYVCAEHVAWAKSVGERGTYVHGDTSAEGSTPPVQGTVAHQVRRGRGRRTPRY